MTGLADRMPKIEFDRVEKNDGDDGIESIKCGNIAIHGAKNLLFCSPGGPRFSLWNLVPGASRWLAQAGVLVARLTDCTEHAEGDRRDKSDCAAQIDEAMN